MCHTQDTFYYRLKETTERAGTRLHEKAAVLGMHSASPNSRSPFAPLVQGTDAWADVIRRATERIRALRPAPPLAAQAIPEASGELALALDLLRRERYVEALALVQALPAESTRDPDVRLLHALLLTHSLELGEAERLCEQLLADDDLNAGAHYLLALCRERAGDCPGAVEHDQYAAYLDPGFAMPRLHLGLLARRNRDGALARRELSQALVLLQREDPSRLLLFGGGFNRETLLALCRAELQSCGGHASSRAQENARRVRPFFCGNLRLPNRHLCRIFLPSEWARIPTRSDSRTSEGFLPIDLSRCSPATIRPFSGLPAFGASSCRSMTSAPFLAIRLGHFGVGCC